MVAVFMLPSVVPPLGNIFKKNIFCFFRRSWELQRNCETVVVFGFSQIRPEMKCLGIIFCLFFYISKQLHSRIRNVLLLQGTFVISVFHSTLNSLLQLLPILILLGQASFKQTYIYCYTIMYIMKILFDKHIICPSIISLIQHVHNIT